MGGHMQLVIPRQTGLLNQSGSGELSIEELIFPSRSGNTVQFCGTKGRSDNPWNSDAPKASKRWSGLSAALNSVNARMA